LPHGAGLLFYSWSTYFGSCPPPARCNRPDPNGTRDSQTWTWDGTRWTEQHPSRAPVAGRLVATPGADGAPTVFASGGATWRWTGSRWAESRARGAAPPNDGFAVYDDVNAEVVAYAGQFPTGGLFYDTWTWDGSWTERYGSIAPVPTTAPPPTTTTSTVPTAGACTSAQLQLTLPHDAVAVMQQPVAFFALTNRSSSACALKGYPELTLYDASGNLIPATIRNGGAYMTNDPGPHPVVVQPGGRAYFGFAWGDVNNREGGTTKGCVSIARLRVFVPAISVSLATAAPLSPLFCPPGGSVTAIAAREAFKVATP
jgi:hypothetical protein